MATPAEIFDALADVLSGFCDAPEVVIQVHMDFTRDPFAVRVVRHTRDPDHLFDKSGDTDVALTEPQWEVVRSKVRAYLDVSRQWEETLKRTTLTVWQDSLWSVGFAMEAK